MKVEVTLTSCLQLDTKKYNLNELLVILARKQTHLHMKLLTLIGFLLLSTFMFSQKEGQNFCDVFAGDSYFPITIKTKKILWKNTYYMEEIIGKKTRGGKEYVEYVQQWEDGTASFLYLREENGVVYQFEECCDAETIRFDPSFKKGDTWKTADQKATYTIETLEGTLKTPFCNYEDLIVIKLEANTLTYKFYYKKGYGYVGTKQEGIVISGVAPY